MPLNKAILAAYKVASQIKPDAADFYQTQRRLENVIAKLSVPNPRCRIESAAATMTDGYSVPLRVFTPLNLSISIPGGFKSADTYRGTILFIHGGGWANGNVDLYIDACTSIAIELERRVISIDYRRSPDHRFPQAAEDCYEVARQLFAGELFPGTAPDSITICGDSAGGNLASVVSIMARDRGDFHPSNQILFYPATYNDHNPSTTMFDSVRENGKDYLLTWRDIEGYMGLYRSSEADLQNPYLAPLLEPDLSDQPRTLLISAEYCPLRDEGETFAARIDLESGEASCYRMLNAVHGYLLYPSVLTVVRDTLRICKHFLDGDPLPQEKGSPKWMKLLGID